MTNGPAIVIRGTREDWPGGPRTLRPLNPHREPNRQTFRFGAELVPGNAQVWFRIPLEAVHRMQEKTPGPRGNRLVDALLAWLGETENRLENVNHFQVSVSEAGDTLIERLR